MESTEQALKTKIIQDLREGKVSRNLILLVLGEGGLRLTRNHLDVIFEWMLNHPAAWSVRSDKRFMVMFARSPFHPEEWGNYEDYKHIMRQMFDGSGTYDFLTARTTEVESYRIMKDIATEEAETLLKEYSNE